MKKVILFGNDKCGSCKRWKPIYLRLIKEYQVDASIKDVDVDKEDKERYNITAIPVTLFLDDNGVELGRILGSMDEDIARKQFDLYVG